VGAWPGSATSSDSRTRSVRSRNCARSYRQRQRAMIHLMLHAEMLLVSASAWADAAVVTASCLVQLKIAGRYFRLLRETSPEFRKPADLRLRPT
jgi:hypothetical protein